MNFLLLGDIHCYGHYVFEAIKQVCTDGGIDAVVGVGDLTNSGQQMELEGIASAVSSALEAVGCPNVPFITPMGNHDYGNRVNTDEINALHRSRFESVIGISYRHITEVKGYTFITFSANNHSAGYTDDDYRWLDAALSSAEDRSDHPVFVCSHYSSYAAGLYGDDKQVSTPLDEVLSRHRRAILLCGHSHAFLANERSMVQSESGYTAINAGSLWQSSTGDSIKGNVTGYFLPVVTVAQCDGDRVKFTRMDITDRSTVGQPWVIGDIDNSLGARALRTPVPAFRGELTLNRVGSRAALISIPQAREGVEYYLAEVCSQSGNATSYSVSSRYYRPHSADICMELFDLEPDQMHTVSVYAVDFFARRSEPIHTAFMTESEPFRQGEVLYEGGIVPSEWSGDVDCIDLESGFVTAPDDTTPFIISKREYDLSGGFEVYVKNSRNRYNNSDTDFSCLKVGRYTAVTCRTKESNIMLLLDGWSIDDGSPLTSDSIIAKAELPYDIGDQTIGMVATDGVITVYRNQLPAICIECDLDGMNSAQIGLRLGETWGVFEKSARFSHVMVKRLLT